ncbi:MAG: hypothetical protein FVQ79_04270 [Planctomycetes bacterium]|nr:hypothetical protein [Planctomycetota bacterium]
MTSNQIPLEIDEIQPLLAELVLHYSHPIDKVQDVYDRVAQNLSQEAGQDPPWTWRYPHQVHRGSMQKPGQRFLAAILQLHTKVIKPKKPSIPRNSVPVDFPNTPQGRQDKQRALAVPMPQRRQALLNIADRLEGGDAIER